MTSTTALCSTLMDDAEPTMAADVADSETQSIHAWSQTDDADTEPAVMPHRRSWKLPLVLAGIATVAVIGAGAYQYWPDHAAVSHPVAAGTTLVSFAVMHRDTLWQNGCVWQTGCGCSQLR
jgi:hypothetical protein